MIHEEEKNPLNVEDYKRAGGLEEQDKSPRDGGLSLYSTDYFEGDIMSKLVNPTALFHPFCSILPFHVSLFSFFLTKTKTSPAGTPSETRQSYGPMAGSPMSCPESTLSEIGQSWLLQ